MRKRELGNLPEVLRCEIYQAARVVAKVSGRHSASALALRGSKMGTDHYTRVRTMAEPIQNKRTMGGKTKGRTDSGWRRVKGALLRKRDKRTGTCLFQVMDPYSDI